EVGSARYAGQPDVDGATHRALIKTSTASPQEERRAASCREQKWATRPAPGPDRLCRGQPERNSPFFVALAEHPDDVPCVVDVVKVEAHEFAHPDAGGVEHFQHGVVAQPL